MIPFIDLRYQHRQVERELRREIEEVVKSTGYILGPAVKAFEEEMAALHGVAHGIGVASGTDALLLSLLAADIGEGDEVLTSPFTFVATAETILLTGARPVFVDIDERTFAMDPGLTEAALTERTRALLPVHLYGMPADMNALLSLALGRGLKVIEDCAQATGARVGDRLVGGLGDAGAFSFFPTKNLGGLGDGGMILTNDDDLAGVARMLRGHGSRERDRYELPGFNSRLDTLQAAALRVKLRRLDEWNEERRQHAHLYRELLMDIEELVLPGECEGFTHVYNQFTLLTPRRDELRRFLSDRGVSSMVYYSRALHLQPVFSGLGYAPGDFPVAEKAQDRVLSLPVAPGLGEKGVRTVAAAIRGFFRA